MDGITGSCHCGQVAFHLTAMPEHDLVYRWNTNLVAHYFRGV